MKKSLLALVIGAIAYPVLGAPRTTEERASDYFLKLQRAAEHREILAESKKLNDAGFTKEGATKAVVLGGGCGFAGCDYTHLVTTDFSTPGANTQTAILAAVVQVSVPRGGESLKRVLNQEEIGQLISGVKAASLVTDCYTTGVTDGGYRVRIFSEGGRLRAEVSAVTFSGTKPLDTIVVERVNQIDGVEYNGPKTRGNTINLTIDYNSKIGEKRYKGYLRGNINGKAIPPTELPEFGEMSCSVPKA